MFLALAICILTLPTLTFAWWSWFRFSPGCRTINRFPGPPVLPLAGNALQLLGGCHVIMRIVQEKWPSLYGEIYRVFVGWKIYLMVSSPEIAEIILCKPYQLLDKGEVYERFRYWFGDGLLTCPGSKWKPMRRLLTPAFHFHILDNFFHTFNEQSSILRSKIDQLCASTGFTDVDVDKLTSLCTLDIICETAMGCKVNAQTQESDYVEAISGFEKILVERLANPWKDFDLLYQKTFIGRSYRRYLDTIQSFIGKVLTQRRKEIKQDSYSGESDGEMESKKRRPFLDLLLEASQDGVVLSDKEIREEVNTFMSAGYDTTSTALNWFLYCMATNPECQKQARDEVMNVFGHSDRPCTRQDLNELKYLDCCIKETLRLYPSAPIVFREAKQDLEIDGYQIPKGCSVGVMIYALHRNPRIFPDPLTFDPQRFADSSSGRHPYAYIPFSAGPRNCLGQRYAMIELKALASSLLRRFKFELSPGAPKPVPSMQVTLQSATGIHLRISKIAN